MESVCDCPFSEVPPARNTNGRVLSARKRDELAHVVDVARRDDGPWNEPVRARVGGVPDKVERPAQDLVGAERRHQFAAERLRRSARHPVGRAIGDGIHNSSHTAQAIVAAS